MRFGPPRSISLRHTPPTEALPSWHGLVLPCFSTMWIGRYHRGFSAVASSSLGSIWTAKPLSVNFFISLNTRSFLSLSFLSRGIMLVKRLIAMDLELTLLRTDFACSLPFFHGNATTYFWQSLSKYIELANCLMASLFSLDSPNSSSETSGGKSWKKILSKLEANSALVAVMALEVA